VDEDQIQLEEAAEDDAIVEEILSASSTTPCTCKYR
jgi:hypothetical protein